MQEVYKRVFLADATSCLSGSNNVAVVHAGRSLCNQLAVSYMGKLHSSHPNYLVLEQSKDLFLNIIDLPAPLHMSALFPKYLNFVKKHWHDGKLLIIDCNKGESRDPSIAVLSLARPLSIVDDSSTRGVFQNHSPRYLTGQGFKRISRETGLCLVRILTNYYSFTAASGLQNCTCAEHNMPVNLRTPTYQYRKYS